MDAKTVAGYAELCHDRCETRPEVFVSVWFLRSLTSPPPPHVPPPVNKSQGQTLRGRVGVDLREGSWTHGQVYVALSRCITNTTTVTAYHT
eukprot:COSAG06_NODE_2252_length_7232_cov_11.789149_3_plen_91_part_00